MDMAAKKTGKAKKTGTKRTKAEPVIEAVRPGKAKLVTWPESGPAKVDARLPPVGTKIEKRDRSGEVRCYCEVVAEGIKYAGNLYSSLSGAAMAAAKDLGLKNKTQNGYVFWGLSKPPRPAADPVEALQRAWARFHERAKAAVAATTDDSKEKVARELAKQAEALDALTKKVA
jgi:hypothetical protein